MHKVRFSHTARLFPGPFPGLFPWLMTALAFLLILSVFGPALHAQGIVPPPGPIPHPRPPIFLPPLPSVITITEHRVNATIDGPVAQVSVTQVFRNRSGDTVEGVFVFPLPGDAAVGDFQMTVDGQVLEGQLLDKDEARSIYDAIVRRNLDPALLEYVGQGLFQTSVFPIPPGAERSLTFTYRQVLPRNEGLFRFSYPLRTRSFSDTPVVSLSVAVELRNQPGLRTIYSPGQAVSISRTGDDGALVGYEAANIQPETDFDLYFGTDDSVVGLNLLSYRPAGEDGFFLLLAAPGVEVAADEIVQRDLVLVLDTSGSMQGEKIVQAQAAARFVVEHLNPGDRFNLIHFNTGVTLWQAQLQEVTAESSADALGWIDRLQANGSTDINRALLEAMAQLGGDTSATRPAYVLFLTDGLPTQGMTLPEGIRRSVVQNAPPARSLRLFTFGVGYDVNTDLLDSLSGDLGGRSTYVSPDERIDEKVSGFYAGISTPVLAQVSVAVQDAAGQPVLLGDSYPYPVPDLFAGEQMVMAGRYAPDAAGPVTVTLSGNINGKPVSYLFGDRQLAAAGGDDFVARLWATRKIGALLEQIRMTGPTSEAVDAIVALSLAYGIVTPYTSYLVLEPNMAVEGRPPFQPGDPGIFPAPIGLGGGAADSVGMAARAAAEAPAAGEAAVAASEVRTELRYAERAQEARSVRFVAGRTFTSQGTVTTADGRTLELWVDSQYDESMPMQTVVFGSPRYAELAGDASMRPWLALSPELVLVMEGEAIRITTAGAEVDTPIFSTSPGPGAAQPTPSPTQSLTSTPMPTLTPTVPSVSDGSDPSPWQKFMQWLKDLGD